MPYTVRFLQMHGSFFEVYMYNPKETDKQKPAYTIRLRIRYIS